MDGHTTLAIVVVLGALLVIFFAVGIAHAHRSRKLRARFAAAEYDRTVKTVGHRRKAEAQLQQREKRVRGFALTALSQRDREAFVSEWSHTQAQFVDAPEQAVTHADQLMGRVMAARGYPMSDFDQQSADLSVDHPAVIENYRTAHDIAVRHAKGEATTEDMRQAIIHYRGLFEELVEPVAETRVLEPAR